MGEKKADITPDNWQFTSVPETEAEACYRYEMLRELRDPREYFLSQGFEILKTPSVKKDRLAKQLSTIRNVLTVHPLEVRKLWISEDTFEEPWLRLPISWRENLAWCVKEGNGGVWQLDFSKEEFPLKPNLYGFYINWNQTNSSLAGDFQRWLVENRPADLKPTIERGKQSIWDGLNALSALRLRHALSAGEATILSQVMRGEPLYSTPFAWDRAADRALTTFKAEFPNSGDPKSASRVPNPRGRPTARRTMKDILIDQRNKDEGFGDEGSGV